MTTIVRAATPADLLALLPAMIGYLPSESLLIVPFAGGRTAGVLRLDIDQAIASPAEHSATGLGHAARVPGVTGVAVVAYTERGHEVATPVLAAYVERARQFGLDVLDVISVGAETYAQLGREEHPVSEINYTIVPEGMRGATSKGVLAGAEPIELDEATRADAADVARQYSTMDPSMLLALTPPVAAASVVPSGETPYTEVPSVVGFTVAVCQLPSIRDVALLSMAIGVEAGDRGLEAQLDWESGAEYPTDLARVMWGEWSDKIDVARLTNAVDLLRTAAAVADEEQKPAVLATLAWFSWALGRSSHAEYYADQAAEVGLAEIVRSFITAGHLPSWAFDR